MSHIPKVTLIGLMQYDEDLFSTLKLPEGYDKDTFISVMLSAFGEFPIVYTNAVYLKWYLGIWSTSHRYDLARIAEALADDYNPLHNYDRYEEYTDNEETTNSLDTSGQTENKVSAYNASTYQPDDQQTNTGTSSGEESRDFKHNGHLYGNIGVTTSQQMLEAEVKLRLENNLYMLACKLLAQDICILIY